MPLDNFEKKVKQATEREIPSFEEDDWQKMEALLDKDLPVKKDQRKFFIILFTFLLLCLLTGFLYFYYNGDKTTYASKNNLTKKYDSANTMSSHPKQLSPNNKAGVRLPADNTTKNIVDSKENIVSKKKQTFDNTKGLNKNDAVLIKWNNSKINHTHKPNQTLAITGVLNENDTEITKTKNNHPGNDKQTFNNADKLSVTDTDVRVIDKTNKPPGILQIEKEYSKDYPDYSETAREQKFEKINKGNSINVSQNKTTIQDTVINEIPIIKSNQKKQGKKNHLAFTLTTGIEASGTRINTPGNPTPVYGFGFQYSIGGKILVRTGLNVVKKIYSAQDGDYHAPPGSWAFNITFNNIEANCKVLEVPLSIAYKIKEFKKGDLYISVGSSSYFMKREDYQFYFKGQNGNDTTRSAHFINNSDHYFSSLNFSAVAEKRINNKFSLLAEPFIKLPLSGIGFGKVSIYNIGVLITAKFQIK